MARLLTPFDFGVYGLGGSIVGVKERLADFGAGSFLLYRPKDFEQHIETTFWVNVVLSSVLLSLLAIAAPVLGKVYREPLLTPVLILLGLGVWARLNASVHQSLLRTEGRFRALALIDNCSSIAWLATAVALAWLGFGVWALVVSAVAANVILAILLIVTQGWRPRWRISKSSLYILGGFSLWYLCQGLAWYVVSNVDRLLIGRYLGMSLLGIYVLAYNYALLPVTTIGNSMGTVGYAELPKLRNQPEAFWPAYLDFSRLLALAGCLVAFAAAVAAPDLIPAVFGMKWAAAVVPFQVLSVYAAMHCLWMDPFGSTGEFQASSLVGLGTLAVAFTLVVLGLRYGLIGVAVAMLLTQAGSKLASLRWVSRSWGRVGEVARATTPYLAGGIVMALVALGVRAAMLNANMPPGFGMAAVTLAIFFGGYGLWFRRDMARMLNQLTERSEAGSNDGVGGLAG